MWMLFGFFGVVSLGQLQRVELSGLPAFYLHDVLLGFFVAWLLTHKTWRTLCIKGLKAVPTLAWLCFAWVGAGLAIAALSGSNITYPLALAARFLLYALASSGLFFLYKEHLLRIPVLKAGILFYVALLLFFGLLQYFFLPDTRFLFFLGWDDHYYRLISTLFDPGYTGLLLALGYLFVQDHFLRPHSGRVLRFRPMTALLSVGLFLGILLTYSRASYLAFGVVILFLIWAKWREGQLQQAATQAFIAVVFVLSLFFLPQPGGEGVKLGRTSTITARAVTAQQSFSNLNSVSTLIIGEGLFVPPLQTPSEYSGTTSHAKVSDNWIVAVLVGSGVVGVVLVVATLIQLLRWSINTNRSYLWIALLAVLAHGLFNASVTFPFVWLVLLVWGVLTLEK